MIILSSPTLMAINMFTDVHTYGAQACGQQHQRRHGCGGRARAAASASLGEGAINGADLGSPFFPKK